MNGKLRILLAVCSLITCLFSCQRSADQVWEDSKTGGNYVSKGFRSAAGKNGSSKQVHSQQEFAAQSNYQQDFIPLNDEDLYQKIALGDPNALKQINAYTPIPQPKESPGDPGSSLPGIDGFVDPSRFGAGNVFEVIYFDTNDYVVRTNENRKKIQNIANYLNQNPTIYLFIEGHCDERGTAAYNLSLGAKRSNSVRAMLIKEGVDMNRLYTISYGKEKPLVVSHSSRDWSKNRRSEFKLYDSKGQIR